MGSHRQPILTDSGAALTFYGIIVMNCDTALDLKVTHMDTQMLEGTFTEVQRRLRSLPLNPEDRVRLIVTESETDRQPLPEPFTPTDFRNGRPLLPRGVLPEPITLVLVRRIACRMLWRS